MGLSTIKRFNSSFELILPVELAITLNKTLCNQ